MKKITFLFLCIAAFATAQQRPIVDLSNPNATVHTHLYFLQATSYQPIQAATTIEGLSEDMAVEKAIKIKKVLDGKGLMVDFSKIPTDPDYNDTIGYVSSYKYVLFPDRMPLVSVEKVGENWYFSKETIQNIDALYNQVFPWYVQKIQQLIPSVGHQKIGAIEVWQLVMVFIFLLAAYLVALICKALVFVVLQKVLYRFTKNSNTTLNVVLKKLAHPISLLLAIAFLDKVFPSLQFGLQINSWVFLGLNIATTIFWIYVFLKLVQVVMRMYADFTARTHGKLDDQLVPILHNFLTGIVVFLGVLKLLTLFGIDTTTVIAGASIGGLAVALASQDTVKNLIGTFMIFLDKPFHIGDWIEADSVVGTVEEVGFRSTRVRGADTSVYQIPNSKLAEIAINNKGLRLYRRYSTNLGLRYDTPPELIEAFVQGIRALIIAHPNTRSSSYNVEFTGFGDSALLILVNVYFKSLEWGTEQSSKHRLHMAIVKLAKALGVDFAFPSSTLMIEQFPGKNNIALNYEIDATKTTAAIDAIVADFSKENPS